MDTCAKHQTLQQAFGMGAEEVAAKIGDLRYDDAAQLFLALSAKYREDSKADRARQRHQLAGRLHCMHAFIKLAADECQRAWQICVPYMK